jgi:hypothetical protein
MNSFDWIADLMGTEYAQSLEGQLFIAFDKIALFNSRQKFRGFTVDTFKLFFSKKIGVNTLFASLASLKQSRNLIILLRENENLRTEQVLSDALKLVSAKNPKPKIQHNN